MTDEAQEAVEFGRFQLLPHRRELLADGAPVALGSRAFDILMMLTEARGELVTKDDILQRVWPGVVVEENNLVVQISTLRKAFGPDRNFIRTESGRGYRFVAEIRTSAAASSGGMRDDGAGNQGFGQSTRLSVPPALSIAATTEVEEALEAPTDAAVITKLGSLGRRAPRLVSWVVFAGALLIVIAAVLTSFFLLRSPTSPKISSIAVLPLENLSGDPSQDYFADGVTEELIAGLAQFRALRVISRTSIMSYKHVRKLLPDVARELNVDAVVEGTVLRSGERVRITVELIELPVERHVWGQSFEADLRDAIPLQTSVAHAIAEQIHAVVSPLEQASASGSKSVDPDAYEAYLKGRYFWNKRSEDGLRKATEYFNLATDKDPTYAKAYSGLADAYALSGDWEYGILSPQDALPKAKTAATKALALDGNLGEAHTSLGFILDLSWDWAGAETEFERAIALYPSYATAHHWHAWHLMVTGRTSEGIAELRNAERLDPLSLIIDADLADALCIAGRYDESITQSRRTLEMDGNFAVAHYELGQALTQKKSYDAAIAEFQGAIELSGSNDIFFAGLARAYAGVGSKDRAQKILDGLERKYREQNAAVEANIAIIYVALGQNDQAMAWLEKAYQRRFNPSILLRPAFDGLRSDGRFQDLLHRIGMPASSAP